MGNQTESSAALDEFCPSELRPGVEKLIPILYDDLRQLARRQRRKLAPFSTLNTTGVVHEAYLRLAEDRAFDSPEHFLRTSAIAMRYVLIDRVRAQQSAKRGGGQEKVALEEADNERAFVVDEPETVLAVHMALEKIARIAPRIARVIECRYFAGYTNEETATALGIAPRTVRRDWTAAQAMLVREMGLEIGNATAGSG